MQSAAKTLIFFFRPYRADRRKDSFKTPSRRKDTATRRAKSTPSGHLKIMAQLGIACMELSGCLVIF